LPKGEYKIGIYIGACPLVTQTTRVISGGFNSPSRMHIEEVRRNNALNRGESNYHII